MQINGDYSAGLLALTDDHGGKKYYVRRGRVDSPPVVHLQVVGRTQADLVTGDDEKPTLKGGKLPDTGIVEQPTHKPAEGWITQAYVAGAFAYTANEKAYRIREKIRDVWVRYKDVDLYSRVVAWVILPSGKDLSRELLTQGAAWHYREYSQHIQELEAIQSEARRGKRGLWALPNPIYPQDWRRGKR